MKLKTKLLITFFTIILVPMALIYVCMTALGSYQSRSLKSDYGISGVGDLYSGASVQVFNSMTMSIQKDISRAVQSDPDQFENRTYLVTLNQRLAGKYSFLIVRKGDAILYNGGDLGTEELEAELPDYNDVGVGDNQPASVFTGKSKLLINQQDLTFSDGTEGSVFIITSVGELVPQVKKVFGSMVMAVLILLIMIAVMLALWIYRAILRPIGELKRATKEIKEGNLDP